jgi:hypothetical protein
MAVLLEAKKTWKVVSVSKVREGTYRAEINRGASHGVLIAYERGGRVSAKMYDHGGRPSRDDYLTDKDRTKLTKLFKKFKKTEE